jgi:hypothetical protein
MKSEDKPSMTFSQLHWRDKVPDSRDVVITHKVAAAIHPLIDNIVDFADRAKKPKSKSALSAMLKDANS